MRHFNTARRLDYVLKPFPGLRRKLEKIGLKYYHLKENWDYDHDYNGERWLLQTLAGHQGLRTVFDVGANRGDWTQMALEANPAATVHCFEICPPIFKNLATRYASSDGPGRNVVLNSVGLSDAPGEIPIQYCPDGDGGSTMFAFSGSQKVEAMKARVVRGKDYCTDRKIESIDLLKLDVEGSEHLVLRGFEDLVTPAKVPVVQFEYGLANILTKNLLMDYYTWFESRGYKVGKLFPTSVRFREYRYQDENFLGPNYVAASPEMAALLGPR